MRKLDYVKTKYFYSTTSESIIINGSCPSNYGLPDTNDEEKCRKRNCLSCWCEPAPKKVAVLITQNGQKGVTV